MNSRTANCLRALVVLAIAWVLVGAPSPARAQSAPNKAAAEALFEEGKAMMQSSNYAQACEKFAASRELDEGIGTLLYLADCYEKIGRTASAWALFKEAASMAGAKGQESRQKLASLRAKNLEPSLVKLTVEVAKANESLLGFEVRNDGTRIPAGQFGVPFPVDPGEHRLEASAPGKRTHSEVVQAKKGTIRVEVPPLAELVASEPSVDAPPHPAQIRTPAHSAASAPLSSPGREDAPTKGASIQRTFALVLGGVGLVGIGLGSYFGLSAIDKNSESKGECPSNPRLCSQDGVDLRNDALAQARLSTIAFASGGAALAAGLALYLTAPMGHSTELALSPTLGAAQLSLSRRF